MISINNLNIMEPNFKLISALLACMALCNFCTSESSNSEKVESVEKEEVSRFIYRDSFLVENLPYTLKYCRESDLITNAKDIPQPLIEEWLHPFSVRGGYKNLMLSYQLKGVKYHSLLLLVVGDELPDSASYRCYDTRQYLLTVDDSGNFIDGLRVHAYESGIDSVINDNPVVMVISNWSKFNKDTIEIFNKTNYLQQTKVENDDFLQEEFEKTDKTTYKIDSFGKLVKIKEFNGDLKKLSR